MSELPPPGYRQWPPANPVEEIVAVLARSARDPWDRIVFRGRIQGGWTFARASCMRGEERADIVLGPSNSIGGDLLRRIPEVARILAAATEEEDAWVEVQITLDRDGKVTVKCGDRDKPLPPD